MPTPHYLKGVFLILIAWVFLTFLIALSRFASDASSVAVVLLFQNAVGLICILPWMLKTQKTSFVLSKKRWHLIRIVSGYLNFAFIFLAIQRTSLVNTVLLRNCAPLFIPLIIWMWRGITLSSKLWMAIIIGFIGVGFVLKPDLETLNTGMFFALAAALCSSISMIAQRRLMKTEQKQTVLFYYFLAGTCISLPFALYNWQPIHWELLLNLILIGCLFLLGQLTFLSAFYFGKPSVLSPFNYISVIYAAIIEWMIWKQIPDFYAVIGILLISAGGILTMLYGNQNVEQPK